MTSSWRCPAIKATEFRLGDVDHEVVGSGLGQHRQGLEDTADPPPARSWANSAQASFAASKKDSKTARRAQIVLAAIDTIAEFGYAQASLTRFADRLEISKGVILYYFDGKDDLVREVIAEVIAKAEAHMGQRIQAAPAGAGKLRAYIQSNLCFMAEYRNEVIAIVELSRNARGVDGKWLFDLSALNRSAAELEKLLTGLQSSGGLHHDLDPSVMAFVIRAAIDAAASRLARDPALDIEHCGRELATLFERATLVPG